MFKGYSSKSKAVRGLSAYGEIAVLAADKLVHMGDVDGIMKWGFKVEQAEAARDGRDFGTFEEQVAAAKEGNPDDASIAAATMEIDATSDGATSNAGAGVFGNLGRVLSNDLPPLAAPAVRGRAARETRYTIEKNRPEQNGIKRPSEGGICRQIWDALDEKRELDGTVPSLSSTKDALSELDQTTVSVQYYRWRKHHGITGRLDKNADAATDKPAGKTLGDKIGAVVGE